MFLLLLPCFIVIYIHYGLFTLIPVLIWTIVFFASSFLYGINPSKIEFRIIRIMSIIVIIFILWYNTVPTSIASVIILPFSMDEITFAKDINRYLKEDSNFNEYILYFWDSNEIKEFLSLLEDNSNYLVYLEFIPSDEYTDVPYLILSKPFLINRFSSETTISKFINDRLNCMVDTYYLDDIVIQPNNEKIGPFVSIKFKKL